jgi:hypothetical protein
MVWAVSTEVAVLWAVVLFWGGYGTRHAVADEPATAAAAPPLSTTLVFADQSECFDGCVGIPFTEYMQRNTAMGQLLALNRTLCLDTGGNVTEVHSATAAASGRSIVMVGHPLFEDPTLGGGGSFNCSTAETFETCYEQHENTNSYGQIMLKGRTSYRESCLLGLLCGDPYTECLHNRKTSTTGCDCPRGTSKVEGQRACS